MGRHIKYSVEELEFIKLNATLPRVELHKQFSTRFNRDDVGVHNLEALRKRKRWMTGRTGCFEKGCVPHPNARPKGPNQHSFKKGYEPKNARPIGSIRASKEDHLLIKVTKNKWTTYQRVMYESYHGSIPDGCKVRFKDGNTRNFDRDNLEAVSCARLMRINGIKRRLPKAVRATKAARAYCELKANVIEAQSG